MLIQFPTFAGNAVAIGRGIEDDGVVTLAAFDFAADEFHRIIGDPADGRFGERGEFGVAAGPGGDVLGRVDVDDSRTGGRGC